MENKIENLMDQFIAINGSNVYSIIIIGIILLSFFILIVKHIKSKFVYYETQINDIIQQIDKKQEERKSVLIKLKNSNDLSDTEFENIITKLEDIFRRNEELKKQYNKCSSIYRTESQYFFTKIILRVCKYEIKEYEPMQ